jgi:hypothetical protein
MAFVYNPNWPLIVTAIAISPNPFDSTNIPTYTDISDRVQTIDSSNGRQYELDTNQSAECSITVLDPDEVFNPSNTSSPFSPNVKTYRRMVDMAMWPQAPNTMGVGVNILNQGTFGSFAVSATRVNLDPSFETYPTGSGWSTILNASAVIVSSPYS